MLTSWAQLGTQSMTRSLLAGAGSCTALEADAILAVKDVSQYRKLLQGAAGAGGGAAAAAAAAGAGEPTHSEDDSETFNHLPPIYCFYTRNDWQ